MALVQLALCARLVAIAQRFGGLMQGWPRLGRLLEIIFAAAVMVAYTYALPEFGFVVSTAVAAALLSWRLGALPPAAIAAGIAISVGIYVIFHLILKLSLAAGPWGF